MIFNPVVAGKGGGGAESVTVTAIQSNSRMEFNLYYAGQSGKVKYEYVAGGASVTFSVPKGSLVVINNGNSGQKPTTTGTCDIRQDGSAIFMIGVYSDATITMA